NWEEFAATAAALLADDGRLVIEFPYGPTMLVDGTFDLAYFEHASYPALRPVSVLFGRHGLSIERADFLGDIHGGSARVWLRRGDAGPLAELEDESVTYGAQACDAFTERVEYVRKELREVVRADRRSGRRDVGY